MKRFILLSVVVVCLSGVVAPSANALRFYIALGDQPYYTYGPGYWSGGVYWVWIPGHWAWRHHHRVWIHGHYAPR